MLCEICNKNEATIHIKEMSLNGEGKTLHICAGCSDKKNEFASMLKDVNLNDLVKQIANDFKGLIDGGMGGMLEQEVAFGDDKIDITCKDCKWTWKKFRKYTRLGCPKCYDAFEKELISGIKSIHNGVNHKGKIPGERGNDFNKKSNFYFQLTALQDLLKEAVKSEDYENAATYRDEISELKKKLGEHE